MKQEQESEDKRVYELPDQLKNCDKPHHRESSLYHQPNHKKHWQKVEREQRVGIDQETGRRHT